MSAVLLAHALGLADPDQGWREDALCAEIGDAPFYLSSGESSAAGRAICQRCASIEPCLEYALGFSDDDDHGVWGGTTPKQRRRIRAARNATGEYPGQRAVDGVERGMNQAPQGTAA